MRTPPLKDKPLSPVPPLPVPRHKARAALFVVVPAIVGGAVGGVIGGLIQWISHASVLWFFVIGFGVLGALLGVRTLFVVLSYGVKHAHEEHHPAHGE